MMQKFFSNEEFFLPFFKMLFSVIIVIILSLLVWVLLVFSYPTYLPLILDISLA